MLSTKTASQRRDLSFMHTVALIMLFISLLALIVVLIPAYAEGLHVYHVQNDADTVIPYTWPVIGSVLYASAEGLTTIAGRFVIIPCAIVLAVYSASNWHLLTGRSKAFYLGIFLFAVLVWVGPLFAGPGADWIAIKGWLDD